jgi:hypothetical protein
MRSYQTARSLFSFLSLCSAALFALGIAVAIAGGNGAAELAQNGRQPIALFFFLGLLPGILMSVVGFFGFVFAQMGRAGVDTAEYSQQMLQVSREQLEVSQQTLRQGEAVKRGFEALAAAQSHAPTPSATYADLGGKAPSEPAVPALAVQPNATESIEYNGKEIRMIKNGYRFAGMEFKSLDLAKRYIDHGA